jgi:hypothetical protein
VGSVAWLVVGVVLAAVLTAALLGHLDWAGRLATRVWHRLRPEQPKTATVSVEQLAADLHRLADGLERVYRQDQPAKMARLAAASLAYDWVLLSAARTLQVPAPRSAPLDPIDRLEMEAALAAQGLDW